MGYRRISGFSCPSEDGSIITEESEVSNNAFPEGRMGQQIPGTSVSSGKQSQSCFCP